MTCRDYLLAVMVAAIWGLNTVIAKLGLEGFPPLLMTTFRFALVSIVLIPVARISRRQLPSLLAASFTLGTLHYGLMFVGLGMSEAGTGAIILQLGAPIAIVLGALVFRERLTMSTVLGLAFGVTGLALLTESPEMPNLGSTFILLISASGWATTNLIARANPAIDPVSLTAWSSLLAIPQVGLGSLLTETWAFDTLVSERALNGWIAIAYSGLLSSVLAYGIWYGLLKRCPMNVLMLLTLLAPVTAVVLGIVFLGEKLSMMKFAGGALILAGVGIAMASRLFVAAKSET